MLVRVGFNVNGEQQISRAFEAYALEVRDMREPLSRMGDVIVDSVRAQFETEGAAGGSPWQPLSPVYAAEKAVRWPGRKILVASGGSKGGALNTRTAVTVSRSRMVYEPKGRAGEILAYHQEGHLAGQGHGALPQRKVVALTTAQKREAVDRVFSEWLNAVRRGPFSTTPR